MSNFNPAFEKIRNEGGYQLTDIAGDRGGQTYAGIARNMHPEWPGWRIIDRLTGANVALSLSSTYARAGSKSLRLAKTVGGAAGAVAFLTVTVQSSAIGKGPRVYYRWAAQNPIKLEI